MKRFKWVLIIFLFLVSECVFADATPFPLTIINLTHTSLRVFASLNNTAYIMGGLIPIPVGQSEIEFQPEGQYPQGQSIFYFALTSKNSSPRCYLYTYNDKKYGSYFNRPLPPCTDGLKSFLKGDVLVIVSTLPRV